MSLSSIVYRLSFYRYAAVVTDNLDRCLRAGAVHLCRLGRLPAGAASSAAPASGAIHSAGRLCDHDLAGLPGCQQRAEPALVAGAAASVGHGAEPAGLAARRAPASTGNAA